MPTFCDFYGMKFDNSGWLWIHLFNYLFSHSTRTSDADTVLHTSDRTKMEFSSAWEEPAIKGKLDEGEKHCIDNNTE